MCSLHKQTSPNANLDFVRLSNLQPNPLTGTFVRQALDTLESDKLRLAALQQQAEQLEARCDVLERAALREAAARAQERVQVDELLSKASGTDCGAHDRESAHGVVRSNS